MTKLNDKLQNTPVSTTAPTDGQVLTYVSIDGKWEPQTSSGGSGPVIQDGGTAGANIRLDTSLASPIDDTQNGIVNISSFVNEAISYTIIDAAVCSGFPTDIIITTSQVPSIVGGEQIVISGIAGTTEANGTWVASPFSMGVKSVQNNGSGLIQIQTTEPNIQLTGNTVNISVVGGTVFGVTNNSGLIQISTIANNFVTGDTVTIYNVKGTTEANGTWIITVIGSTTFTLNGSTFTNAYTSGGQYNLGTDVINGTWTVTPVVTGISNVSNNSGTIKITLSSITTINDNDTVVISGVTGTTEANGTWTVAGSTVFGDGLNFNLSGSTFTNAYISGGSANFTTEFTLDSSSGGFSISNVNSANPVQITTTNPNTFVTGDIVNIAGVGGVSINNNPTSGYTITVIDSQNFTLNGIIGTPGYVSDTGYASYTYALSSGVGAGYSANGTFLGEDNILIPVTLVHPYVSGGTITYRAGVFGSYSDIIGGDQNYIDGYYSMIGGGNQNSTESGYTVIAGGFQNTIVNDSDYSVITGGFRNIINANGFNSGGNLNGNEGYTNASGVNVINGGVGNVIGADTSDNSDFCLIEGVLNTISNSSSYSHAEGFANQMYDCSTSHIEGGFNYISSGGNTHIEGSTNNSEDDNFCHIEGDSNTTSSNNYTHVEGTGNIANNTTAAHIQGTGAAAERNAQDAMASGSFATQGDAQVSNLVLRGQSNGSFQLGYSIVTGNGSGTNLNLVTSSATFIIEAVAQDLNTGDYASFQQTHLIFGNSGSATYVGCAPYLSGSGPFAITNVQNVPQIQITTGTPNGFIDGQTVLVTGVLGTTEANGTWIITVIDSENFTLNGSTGVNPYTSGGFVSAIYPVLTNGGPPVIATQNSANPFVNWSITGSTDGTNMIFTFTDLIGSDSISVVANVRFIENNSA